jgi:PAS domain S-box-containing protein
VVEEKPENVLTSGEIARELLEAIPDALVVVDWESRIVAANGLALQLFGYGREEMVGRGIELLIPPRHHEAHLRARAAFLAKPEARPVGEQLALCGARKDGQEFPAEVRVSVASTPLGLVAMVIIRDVTKRRQAEARHKVLLESAPDAIVAVDRAGRIVLVNGRAEEMFGYDRRELLGQRIEMLVPERHRGGHAEERAAYVQAPVARPMGASRPLTGRRRDGSEFPIELSLSPFEAEEGLLVTSIVRDISGRRAAEEKIRASLQEKEVLLKEIHHRVKNNLQVISSLLRMQVASVKDAQVRAMFDEAQHRIRSMALVHELLYGSKDLSRIDVLEYVRRLASLLFRSHGAAERVRLSITGDPLFIGIDLAVPCGIIANELISNCLKHAFPGERTGSLSVRIEAGDEDCFTLVVSDDGVGLPEATAPAGEGLGLSLVRALADQIHAKVTTERAGGTTWRIAVGEAG